MPANQNQLILNNKLKRWRLYDIVYRDNKSGPAEIVVDLSVYEDQVDMGPGNLNSRAYKAVKASTGLEMYSCKAAVK